MKKENHDAVPSADGDTVRFGGGGAVALGGVVGGTLLAVGVSVAVLAFGSNLGTAIQTTLIILALLVGGTVALLAVILGLVMPSQVRSAWADPDRWIRFAQAKHRARHRWGRGGDPWGLEPEPPAEDKEEGPRRGPSRR